MPLTPKTASSAIQAFKPTYLAHGYGIVWEQCHNGPQNLQKPRGMTIWVSPHTASGFVMQTNQRRVNYRGSEHGIALSGTTGVKCILDDIIQGEREKKKGKQLFLHLKCWQGPENYNKLISSKQVLYKI
ncbi:hypothetical protein BCON_0008g00010 [Botryotinia convoluta]|uniref:Uncharacterized protein n=1 Tax=Botryotinia convoluta TaxID=54673 RepID=A0A4Z1ITZ5_9HELO|nr:hypothetical protein BCON_0008g00010 [Botryotinia convoluta]